MLDSNSEYPKIGFMRTHMNNKISDFQEGRFAKMTKDRYYFRYQDSDGSNRFCYVYMEDQGSVEHPMTESQYRAIRGISEVLL